MAPPRFRFLTTLLASPRHRFVSGFAPLPLSPSRGSVRTLSAKAKEFSVSEWDAINTELSRAITATAATTTDICNNKNYYGFPKRVYGSALLGSFNIRKMGKVRNRSAETWKFLGRICQQFDLLAVQETLDDMAGLQRLRDEMGGPQEYGMVVSDSTGKYPGDRGSGERLAFLYRRSTMERGEVVSDVTYDRSKIHKLVLENLDEIVETAEVHKGKMEDFETGKRKTKPTFVPPTFLSFIRQPFCASFSIKGFAGTKPYQFMAINAHLIFGTTKDRWREFEALMDWIRNRLEENDRMYFPNFMLFGDMNLNYDNPERDFPKLERFLKTIEGGTGADVNVNFPFLDVHPDQTSQFTSNAIMTQRYDQIGLFFEQQQGHEKDSGEDGLPTYRNNRDMGKDKRGPDYGVFNFTELFAKAITGKSYLDMTTEEQRALTARFVYEVSDHFPIWVRLKLPDE